ncbi:MAG: hypothetical protein ABI127_11285 [Dokdonella sp.]
MNRHSRVLVAGFLLVLSACASNGRTQFTNDARVVVDQQYVNEINSASRKIGVDVTWINPPTKRLPRKDDNGN